MNSKPKRTIWPLPAVACLAAVALVFSTTAAAGPSGSNASNMGGDASLQVNPRTGGVSLEAELFSIHGINEDVDLAFSLTYQSEDAISDQDSDESVFGLPYGWSMNLSYIENKDTYLSVNLNGNQEYVYDDAWRTSYTPAGSDTSQTLLTGLKEYNRTDTNLQNDASSVEVDGISSQYKMTTMSGVTQYFSDGGLLLKKVDRFGNGIDFYYNADAEPRLARIAKIVDSWGNEIVFSYCTDGGFVTGAEHTKPGRLRKLLQVFKQCNKNPSHPLCRKADVSPASCSDGDVRIDLPDGRSVGWSLAQGDEIRELVDAQGKATVLDYSNKCSGDYEVLSAVTSPAGASTSIRYQCMNVCTQDTYPENCTNYTKQWPVAWIKYDCPSNPSGNVCTQGSAADNLTTRFLIGGTDSTNQLNNYTGYPWYSPYDATDPSADALMQSNNNDFEYVTTAQTLDSDATPIVAAEYHYNFLHLETEIIHYARDTDGNWPAVAKRTSNCFDLTGEGPSYGCPMVQVPDYTELPANYQSSVMTGTCVYALGGQPGTGARLSIVGKSYDSFGNMINRKAYHGTSATGIVPDCSDRSTRMDPSPLHLVLDSYLQYHTPSAIQGNFLVMGQGSGRYGLLTGGLAFLYEDPDDGGAAPSTTPLSVTLSCNTLTTDDGEETAGTAVKSNLFGSLPTDTSVPTTLGIVKACDSPSWDETVAPPKLTTYTHDGAGRVVEVVGQWGGSTGQPGIASTQTSFTYALTDGVSGESACADGKVLQKTTTDAKGYQSVSRVCTQNSFFLSSADEEGRTVTYSHDPVGLATRITQPNGSYQKHDYYYACPLAGDGTPTCPDGNTANGACPYGDQTLARSCTLTTKVAGTGNESYMDGVFSVIVKDGSGRTIQTLDNLGPGSSGAGYDQLQTRSRSTFNDLGLLVEKSTSIGVSDPDRLIYTTTSGYGPKLRPILACGPRLDSHQIIHDDLGQHAKRAMNGHQLNRISMNDSQKLTGIQDCPVAETTSLSAGANCPTVTTDTTNAACSGNIYLTEIKRDGAGNQRGVTASDPDADGTDGASIGSVSAAVTYSAELHKYGFSVQGTAVGSGQSVSASAAWQRDLNGLGLGNTLGVTAGGNTSSFSSSSFAFDELREHISETNALGGGSLATVNSFTPTRKLSTHTDYAGTEFHSYYDDMDWLVRSCYPGEDGGSQGEITTHDPITGEILSISHFTNPGDCSACSDGDCGDVVDSRIDYTYNAFGGIELKTYSENLDTGEPFVTSLDWAYDQYQRPVCFADASATRAGYSCPDSPVADDWTPSPEQELTRLVYWPDDDAYRRGMLKASCRGIPQKPAGEVVYSEQCIESDYYTSVDTGGACNDGPDGAGAYAGLMKTSTMCLGGSCDDGGSIVYQTSYQYDPHRRACSVQTINPAAQLILGSSYAYDQYDNLISESHSSELDTSDESNYQVDYTYDGLMRLIYMSRSDSDDNPLETISYEYNAASHISKKVKTSYE